MHTCQPIYYAVEIDRIEIPPLMKERDFLKLCQELNKHKLINIFVAEDLRLLVCGIFGVN